MFSIMLPEWENIVEAIEEKSLTLSGPDLNDICRALSLAVETNEKDLAHKLRRRIVLEGEDVTS